jgi:hypothetical protein
MYNTATSSIFSLGSAIAPVQVTRPTNNSNVTIEYEVTMPTLYDTTGLFWPRVPIALLPQALASAASSRLGANATSQILNMPVVLYGMEEGEECTLDMASTTTLRYCRTGLVGG